MLHAPSEREEAEPSDVHRQQVSQIVERAEGLYQGAVRRLGRIGSEDFGELLGLRSRTSWTIATAFASSRRTTRGEQEDFSRPPTAERYRRVALQRRKTAPRAHRPAHERVRIRERERISRFARSNILKRYLHPILMGDENKPGCRRDKKAGEHAFRRFRDGYLRTQRARRFVKYWMGHCRSRT